jgi:hypothetical protein
MTITLFTVSNQDYFPGTVALLNSLRLTGNDGELVVLDVDLTSQQRKLLEPHCTLVTVPHEVGINPLLLKAFPAALDPEGVVMIIDSDIIVTGSLSDVVEQVDAGIVCAYPDTDSKRWFPEWEDVFGLTAPLRRQTYVNSGFVSFSTMHWPALLSRWRGLSESIPSASTRAGGAVRESPLWDGDQDALNAILMSEVPEDALVLLPNCVGPSWVRRAVEVTDADRLACSYQGLPCLLVHSSGAPKPWQAHGWQRRIRHDAYVRLLPRVLFAEDLAIRLAPSDAPFWLRTGVLARLAARTLDAIHTVRAVPGRLRRGAASALYRTAP